jgi:Flp pilus assembly protein protease CpaA
MNTYHNLQHKENLDGENATGADSDYLNGTNRLVVGVLMIAAVSSVFVLPKPLKVFWLLIVGITAMMHIGFGLYKEWMELGQSGGEDNKRYAEWAKMILYVLVWVYTAVMVGLLFFMAWSLYSIANSKSNIARLDEEAMTDYENEQKSSSSAMHSHRMGRRHHRRSGGEKKKRSKHNLSRMYS